MIEAAIMKEDSMLFSVSPEAYAEYLEQLSDAEFWEHAYEKAHVSHSTHPTQTLVTRVEKPEDTLTCVTCQLRAAQCILPLTSIREILPTSQRLTLLPDIPFWMLGILSWRNEIVAAIDLCSYLTQSESPPLRERVILVVQHQNLSLALCVLSITSALSIINTSQITPLTFPLTIAGHEVFTGLAGTLEQENAGQEKTLALDMPTLFKDVMGCIDRQARYE